MKRVASSAHNSNHNSNNCHIPQGNHSTLGILSISSHGIFQKTVFKGGDLIKLIIFAALLGTFLREAGGLLRVCGGEAHYPADTDSVPALIGVKIPAVLPPLHLHHQCQC